MAKRFSIPFLLLFVTVASINSHSLVAQNNSKSEVQKAPTDPYVVVLGVAQDAGFPQAGCHKDCCRNAWTDPGARRFPTSIAVVDPVSDQRWLFDCSWQLPDQLRMLDLQTGRASSTTDKPLFDGIFLTHGHIGHYTGLMHLGREVMGTKSIPVFAMPQMKTFLANNGPWSLLVKLNNIQLNELTDNETIILNERISVTPLTVPHRGEFTETVGFLIETSGKSVFFLPDIDKWDRWETKIEDVLSKVDLAFLDATFFEDGEIPGRDMLEIPHPFVQESIARFQPLEAEQRKKIHFIHLNHTNTALDPKGAAAAKIRRAGMNLAEQGKVYSLKK